ncbi:MAG: competence protein ComEA [Solirubrobacteraceae bacterium]|jgi:competence protein ComEA|nr:competence protein ComEA [Solirubrobacteraceae bacterium]
MPEITPRQIAGWVAGVLVLAVVGLVLLHRRPAAEPVAAPAALNVQDDGGAGGPVLIDVAGAVRRPGVYRLRAGARVTDAVERAGGARRGADLSAINLAQKLEDGRQVLVPKRIPGGAAAATASASGLPGSVPALPVDLNTATLEQLDTLDGVGPATAQKILEYRQQHGGFGSVEELGQVSGIGPKRLAALRDHVRV